ncbi:MAG TPA: LLM class flavin-dependent oxidoreductase [Nevskia sp.]|nr:LLM class flavin-dependent oxidoreductase [Nevskia sp.]
MNIPLSVLDLAPVPTGTTAAEAARRTVDLARLADRLGYVRYWFAEHHSMASVASSYPEILIAHVAAATSRIRVGSGGIMLPNHAPLRVAEAFHTLEALHPGRIDLGLGRAPGSEPAASRALRAFDGEQFPSHLAEMLALSRGELRAGHPLRRVRVMPEVPSLPPIWLLGSSGASARMAGDAGMGYSFASHFSPTPAGPAFAAYREAFKPSAQFQRPHAILGVAVVCAETEARAQHLAGTMELARLRINRGEFLPLPSPEEAQAYPYTEGEREALRQYRGMSITGAPDAVRAQIEAKVRETGADEVMVVSNLHGHAERLRSYELLAQAFGLAAS